MTKVQYQDLEMRLEDRRAVKSPYPWLLFMTRETLAKLPAQWVRTEDGTTYYRGIRIIFLDDGDLRTLPPELSAQFRDGWIDTEEC